MKPAKQFLTWAEQAEQLAERYGDIELGERVLGYPVTWCRTSNEVNALLVEVGEK